MTSKPIERYLAGRKHADRLQILQELRDENKFLPLSLAKDLFELKLPMIEHIEILKTIQSSDNLAFEHFLTSLMSNSHQDIAVAAFVEWRHRTKKKLWYRLIQIVNMQHVPQRLRFSMVYHADKAIGRHLLKAYTKFVDLKEFSSAFHGIIFQKALQWDCDNKTLHFLAAEILTQVLGNKLPNEKAIPGALIYLARFAPERLLEIKKKGSISPYWLPVVDNLVQDSSSTRMVFDRFKKALAKHKIEDGIESILSFWPNILSRPFLDGGCLTLAIEVFVRSVDKNTPNKSAYLENLFSGINDDLLTHALCAIQDSDIFAKATDLFEPCVAQPYPGKIFKDTVRRLRVTEAPDKFLAALSPRLREQVVEENRRGDEDEIQLRLKKEEQDVLKIFAKNDVTQNLELKFEPYPEAKGSKNRDESDASQKIRQAFFDLAYRGTPIKELNLEDSDLDDSYWGTLIQTWISPTLENLDQLTPLARKQPALLQACYIRTMGQFKGEDQAALKLLDYIRTDENLEMLEIVQALAGINTSRSTQELVAAITRPNVSNSIQVEICNRLADLDVASVQGEIRSAISDLNPRPDKSDGRWEVREALENLLSTESQEEISNFTAAEPNLAGLDDALKTKIPYYDEMSSEVKRALRTAEFFYRQVTDSNSKNVIDLSPVIDMQYKALELTFRELFEEPCKQVIHMGVLQRKLDLIGYARPIEQSMSQFENYIGSLPVINSIPFFSKFKLRKMLRAICQFRPGRRFTLDGLKAFGLFFFCFGRGKCSYGLQNIFPLPFENDDDLADFCKTLHIFQDFRNRAAHEGFRPEAANDIEEIWNQTGKICENAYRIAKSIRHQENNFIGKSTDSAVKGYKPAKGVQIVHKNVS